MEKANILVVDDDKEIAELVGIHLREEGYEVYKAYSGKEALEIFKQERIDLVILDVMMPVMDGNQVCSKIRDTSAVPIIMLSAKDAEMDMVSSLYQGADDYVTKPFRPMELMARVKSQLRRFQSLGGGEQEKAGVIDLPNLWMDKKTRTVKVYDREVKLTPIEFDLLYLLASHPGQVFATDDIFEKVWKEKSFEMSNTVMVHIRRLRGKVEIDPRNAKIIKTVWGVGYKIDGKKIQKHTHRDHSVLFFQCYPCDDHRHSVRWIDLYCFFYIRQEAVRQSACFATNGERGTVQQAWG